MICTDFKKSYFTLKFFFLKTLGINTFFNLYYDNWDLITIFRPNQGLFSGTHPLLYILYYKLSPVVAQHQQENQNSERIKCMCNNEQIPIKLDFINVPH